MEEVLFAKALDLFVDPVKQCCVTLVTAGAIVSALPRDGIPTV